MEENDENGVQALRYRVTRGAGGVATWAGDTWRESPFVNWLRGNWHEKRWFRWRPNMSILMHHEFPVHELVLIYHKDEQKLLDLTVADMSELSPETEVTT